MKRTLTIIGTLLLAAAIATPVFARGRGKGMRPGGQVWPMKGGFDNLTEEQRSQLDKLHQKFFDETAQLRTEILSKRAEFRILLNTSNPDAEKVKGLQKDISDLEAKMAQERINFLLEARKINPDLLLGTGFGRRYRPHMKGFARGRGYCR